MALRNKKTLLIGILVVVVAGAAGVGYKMYNDSKKPKNNIGSDGINYAPPTEQDKKNVDQTKQNLPSESESTNNSTKNSDTSSPQTQGALKPVVTYAGQYGAQVEVGAYVNVFEDSGTCTATFTKDGKTVTKSVQAIKNVSSVDCPAISIASTEFASKGSWNLVVSYSSSAHQGKSDSKAVEVQ